MVLDGGAPVPGALVVLGDLDSSDGANVTGPDGRFAIDEFPSYSTLHAFSLRGDAVWHGEEPADGGPFDWKVTLKPPVSPRDRVVLVHVLGPDGQPIPKGRAVAVQGRVREPWRLGSGHERETAVAGGWFPVPASRWREGDKPVFLVDLARDESGRALPFGSALVQVDPRGPPSVDVRLPSGGMVQGRVVQPDGSPAGRATVYFEPPLPAAFDRSCMERPSRAWRYTDEDGHFDFSADFPGQGVLLVEPSKGEHGGSGVVPVEVGGPEVVVALRREIALTVLVSDAQGSPVRGATVQITDEGSWKAVTGKEGTCIFSGVPEGADLILAVDHGDYVLQRSHCISSEEGQRITLQRGGTIRGRVIGPDGVPVEEVPILVDPPGVAGVSWWTSPEAPFAKSFCVNNLPTGARVSLSLTDGTRRFGTVDAVVGGAEVTLEWPAEEERLTLILGDVEGEWASGVVLREGPRVVASIPRPGPVACIPAKGLPPVVDIQIGPTSDGEYAFLHRVPSHGFWRVDVRRTKGITGSVKGAGGEAVEFAQCVLTTEEGFVHTFETDVEGKFTVNGIPSGRVTLKAAAGDGRAAELQVESPSDGVELVLRGR